MYAQLYMKHDANRTKDEDSTSRMADLDKPIDGDSETFASEPSCAKSELGERIRPHDERGGKCVEVEQNEGPGRVRSKMEGVLDNNTLKVHQATETVVVLVLHRAIGGHANMGLLESILRPAVDGLVCLWG